MTTERSAVMTVAEYAGWDLVSLDSHLDEMLPSIETTLVNTWGLALTVWYSPNQEVIGWNTTDKRDDSFALLVQFLIEQGVKK